MNDSAKRIARLAALTALGVVLLLLVNVIPSGRLALMLLASFPVCAALMMFGPAWAAGVFAVTAALGFLLFPGVTAVGYAAFFGYYPILKSLIERCRSKGVVLLLKAMLYAVVFALYWLFARAIFAGAEAALPGWALFLAGAAAFAVYDWCYVLAIQFYLTKIARYIP